MARAGGTQTPPVEKGLFPVLGKYDIIKKGVRTLVKILHDSKVLFCLAVRISLTKTFQLSIFGSNNSLGFPHSLLDARGAKFSV